MVNVSYSGVESSAAIALLLVRSTERRSSQWPYVKDISELFFRLREKGFRFRDFGLRRIPDGYYSEDVENFVGQLLSMGYATQRSPITLDDDGVRLCKKILARESETNGQEFCKLEGAVDELLQHVVISA